MQVDSKIMSPLLLSLVSLPQNEQPLLLFRLLFAVDRLKEMSEDLTQSQYEEKFGKELSQNQNNYLLSTNDCKCK